MMSNQVDNKSNIAAQVFPVRKVYDSGKGKWLKRPAVPKGESWKTYKATAKELELCTNIGAVVPKGRVVIDLDTYKGVTRQAVDAALGVSLDWDSAIIQKTVSGGEHYCFELPEGAAVPQGDSLLGVAGFDTRCAEIGWICSGDGYTDCSTFGMPSALFDEPFPELPAFAVYALNGGSEEDSKEDAFDLQDVLSQQPLDGITLADIRDYLSRVPVEALDSYGSWIKIGFAVSHQTGNSEEGFAEWVTASRRSKHFDESECAAKWRSFAKASNVPKPARFDYVIHLAGGRSAVALTTLERLAEKVAGLTTMDDYQALKRDVLKIDMVRLPRDMRGKIAHDIYTNFGKAAGLSKSDIKAALMPARHAPSVARTGEWVADESPEWAHGWVYVEAACEFHNLELGYSIKREAFDAKYGREQEPVAEERRPSDLALNDYRIPLVVNTMFWPGADRVFEWDGKRMLNTYTKGGAEPCAELDVEGANVVERLLAHVAFTLSDKREQEILLDFLTYVYQNPGKRIGWALLLQGVQGSGKSYFASVMQSIMGDMVSQLDPMAISGNFTGWAQGSVLVVVEEMRIAGANKYEILDRMKPFITNDSIRVEEKYQKSCTVPNFSSYLMLSNHKDAIPLHAGDRRYCALFSRIRDEQHLFKELGGADAASAYFAQLFEDIRRRPDALAHFFTNRKVSSTFEPRGRAPITHANAVMQDAAFSPERSAIEDAIERHRCAVIGDDLVDVTWLNELVKADGNELPKTRTMSTILLEMGYEPIPGRRVKVSKLNRYHYVWGKDCAQDDSFASAIRQFFEEDDYVPF